LATLCDALKFHLLPYVLEIGLSGLEQGMSETYSARLFFQTEFLSLLSHLAQLDVRLRRLDRSQVSHFKEKVLSSALI